MYVCMYIDFWIYLGQVFVRAATAAYTLTFIKYIHIHIARARIVSPSSRVYEK